MLARPNLQHSSAKRLTLLLLTIAAGFWLRLLSMNGSLWIDELHTAWVVLGQWSDVAPRARLGNNSPSYFYLVRGVSQLLGTHEWTLRALSLAAGCGLIGATYAVVRGWKCPSPCPLLAAALVAFDRHAVFFSTEARTYGLVQLISLGHLYSFVQLLIGRHQRWSWIGWVISGLLLFHLHCTTALVIGAEVLVYLALLAIHAKSGSSKLLKRLSESRNHSIVRPGFFVLGLVIMLIGMLPAMELIRQLAARRDNWAQFVATTHLFEVFTLYPLHIYVLAPVVVAALFRLVSPLRRHPNQAEENRESDHEDLTLHLIVCAAWLVFPVLAAWILTEFEIASLYYRRYVVASSASLALLAVLLVSRLLPTGRAMWAAAALVLVVAVFSARPASRGEDWRAAIALLNEQSAEIPVILYSGLIEADRWHDSAVAERRGYLQFPVRGMYPLGADRDVISLPRTHAVEFTAEQRDRVASEGAELLIRGRSRADEVVKAVLAALGQGFGAGEERTFGGNIRVVHIAARRPSPSP